jgi:hypothetical protein
MRWNLFGTSRPSRPVRSARPAVRPALEVLEAREVPTALAFTLNPALSSLTLSGNISVSGFNPFITPQGPGALTTQISGTLSTQYDPSASTLQFLASGTNLSAANSGNWSPLSGGAPGSAPANLGGHVSVSVIVEVAAGNFAIRGLTGNLSTPSPVLVSGTSFPSVEQVSVTGGVADYLTTGIGATSGTTPVGGTAANMAGNGTLSHINGTGCYHIVVPVNATFTQPLGTSGVTATFNVSGTLVGDSCPVRLVGGVLVATNNGPAATLTLTHDPSLPNTILCGSSFPDASYSSVVINTGAGDDTVAIENTLAGKPVTINAGGGNNTFNISPAARFLDNIQGTVTVIGGAGSNRLQLYDQADGNNDTWTLNTGNLTRVWSALISYTNVSTVNVWGGWGYETYNINGNGAGVTTTVTGGSGGDAFNLAPTSQVLSNIQGVVNCVGGAWDALLAFDQLDPANATWTINSSSLTCAAGGSSGLIRYSNIVGVNAYGGSGNCVWNIDDTPAGTRYVIVGGAGNNNFRLCTPWHNLGMLQGFVNIWGSGTNTIGLDDSWFYDNYTIQQDVLGFGSVTNSLPPFLSFDATHVATLKLLTSPASVVNVSPSVTFTVLVNPAGGI